MSHTIATICARAGSQGVPGKNIRLMRGKPLIAYTIEQAHQSESIDEVFVSTDSPVIAEIAVEYGATVLGLRPSHLATSEAGKLPVISHLISSIEDSGRSFSRLVDLDPTSPLRTVEDIDQTIQLLDEETDLVITGYLSDKNPYFNMVEYKEDGSIKTVASVGNDVLSRQSAPSVYAMNGSVYCWWRHTFTESLWDGTVKMHKMPRERSIDIDHEIDWKLVELLFKENSTI